MTSGKWRYQLQALTHSRKNGELWSTNNSLVVSFPPTQSQLFWMTTFWHLG